MGASEVQCNGGATYPEPTDEGDSESGTHRA
jgi:hypothetical protein